MTRYWRHVQLIINEANDFLYNFVIITSATQNW